MDRPAKEGENAEVKKGTTFDIEAVKQDQDQPEFEQNYPIAKGCPQASAKPRQQGIRSGQRTPAASSLLSGRRGVRNDCRSWCRLLAHLLSPQSRSPHHPRAATRSLPIVISMQQYAAYIRNTSKQVLLLTEIFYIIFEILSITPLFTLQSKNPPRFARNLLTAAACSDSPPLRPAATARTSSLLPLKRVLRLSPPRPAPRG